MAPNRDALLARLAGIVNKQVSALAEVYADSLEKLDWTDLQAELGEEAVSQYRDFLVLKRVAGDKVDNLTPGPRLDRVWRAHLLRPQHYSDVCTVLLESIGTVYEYPLVAGGAHPFLAEEDTRSVYLHVFGEECPWFDPTPPASPAGPVRKAASSPADEPPAKRGRVAIQLSSDSDEDSSPSSTSATAVWRQPSRCWCASGIWPPRSSRSCG